MKNYIDTFFIKNINIYSLSYVHFYDKFNRILIIFKNRQQIYFVNFHTFADTSRG
jgi:hypothetical protein